MEYHNTSLNYGVPVGIKESKGHKESKGQVPRFTFLLNQGTCPPDFSLGKRIDSFGGKRKKGTARNGTTA